MPLKITKLSNLKDNNSLLDYLHKSIVDVGPPRSPYSMHASNIIREDVPFCARERALHISNDIKPKSDKLSASMGYTFKLGESIASIVIDQFAKDGHAYGVWRCNHCNNEKFGNGDLENFKCENCGYEAPPSYEECFFLSKKTGIRSSIDLLTDLTADKGHLRIIEIKSMEQSKFRSIKAPLAEHRLRTNFYLRNVEESVPTHLTKKVHTDYAYIIYATKGFGDKGPLPTGTGWDATYSPFKVYTVTRDDKVTDKFLQQPLLLKQWVQDYQNSHNTHELPARTVCSNLQDDRAKLCQVRHLCFQK